jgi:pimeloyl-ACP methyl ester carboxylesterase
MAADHPDIAAPALPLLIQEIAAFAYMRTRATFAPAVPTDICGTGAAVMVIPGFMASDRTTGRLRRSLEKAGFISCGWGLGRNRGINADTLHRIDAQLAQLSHPGPVILVGWSLGGLIAREYAKYAPNKVARVITLGSPFSGDPRANNAWRAYEFIAGHRVDNPPIPVVLAQKPPVHTTAFWSHKDGVVAAACARGSADEADEQIELSCSHMAFVADPSAIRAVIAALGQTTPA